MSIYGYTTKRDLTKLGSFLMMGLIGIIIASIVNIFHEIFNDVFRNFYFRSFNFCGTYCFTILKKLRTCTAASDTGELMGKKAVMGALTLYLDFINLFIMLAKTFWSKKIKICYSFFQSVFFNRLLSKS